MLLSIKRGGQHYKDMKFDKGPVYIGRQMGNQVLLPDKSVSRQHAVIYQNKQGHWIIEDLDSSNKTYLNGSAVHKQQVNDFDQIRITQFTIEFLPEKSKAGAKKMTDMESRPSSGDSHVPSAHGEKELLADTLIEDGMLDDKFDLEEDILVRKTDSKKAPVTIPTKRLNDFGKATESLCKAESVKDMQRLMTKILFKQFTASKVWLQFRTDPDGKWEIKQGQKINTEKAGSKELAVPDKIEKAIQNEEYFLVPGFDIKKRVQARSAMVVPVLTGHQCFGVIYVENSRSHEPYNSEDLDYLMLLSIHVAAVLENL